MTITRLLSCCLVVTLVFTGPFGQATETEELTIEFDYLNATIHTDVDIPETNTLVTGIDVDRLMTRLFYPSYDRTELGRSNMTHYAVYRWQHYVGLPEQKFNPNVQLDIGVYKSHKEAVKMGLLSTETVSTGFKFKQKNGDYYELLKPGPCTVQIQDNVWVKNNVFISLRIYTGEYDKENKLNTLFEGIERGLGEIITVGETVDIPVVDDSALPDEITFTGNETLSFTVTAIEPNNLEYEFQVSGRLYLPEEPSTTINLPLQWDRINGLQIQHNGSMETALITGTVTNELNVFSELWKRKIKINAPANSNVSHASSM